MIQIDRFLSDFESLKQYSRQCEYKDEVNPVDGVVYPLICKDIPQPIIDDLLLNLNIKALYNPSELICFLRMSPKNVSVPHKFHTDHSMGRHSLMLYLEDREDAGTGFGIHLPTGCYSAPTSEEELKETIKDCNNDSKWKIYKQFKMRENRAVMFDSQLFHVALPIGGYGEAKEDSRIVFTCFFS